MSKFKQTLAAAAWIGAICAASFSTYALLQEKKPHTGAQITMGSVHAELLEKVDNTDYDSGRGTTKNQKEFWVAATGSKATIVRAKIHCAAYSLRRSGYVPIAELNDVKDMKYDANGNPTAQSPFTYNVLYQNSDWEYNPYDGYWYYMSVLNQNGTNLTNPYFNSRIPFDFVTPDNLPASTATSTKPLKINEITIGGHNARHPLDNDNSFVRWIDDDTRMDMNIKIEAVQASNGAYLLTWGDVNRALIGRIGGGIVARERDEAIKREANLKNNADKVLTNAFPAVP